MDLIPNAEQKKNIRERKQALADFKLFAIALQALDISMKESDVVFQSIIDEYTEFDFESYLGADASIIHNQALETAIVKIQLSKEGNLTEVEKQAVSKLLLRQEGKQAGAAGYNGEDDTQLSFAERALKGQFIQEKTECSKYVNTNFLLLTLCLIRRLFSPAKRVFSPHRRRLSTKTLEALLFFNQNRKLWNLALVALVVNERDAELVGEEEDVEGADKNEEDEWE
jgi:hypothetical protein